MLSFIIPCYRSEKTLEAVVNELVETVIQRAEYDYEVILVNDGSPDNVQDVIDHLCAQSSKIRGIELARNFGQPNAQMAGYSFARGDLIIDLDDDGQTPICEVYTLIDKLLKGYDAVYADYSQGKKHSYFRNLASKINQRLAFAIYKQPKNIRTSSFHVLRRFIIEEILKYKNPYPANGAFVFLSSSRIASVPLAHRERLEGRSGYTLKKLFKLWSNALFNFSLIPLRISIFLGIFSALTGFVMALLILVRRLAGSISVSGWTSNIIVTLLIGGMVLIMLGIVGEYAGRIFLSINHLPQYVVRATRNIEDASVPPESKA